MAQARPVTVPCNQDASNYDRHHDEDPFFTKIYDPLTWDNIQRFLPPPGRRILDAGGGTGRWAIQLARMGYQVTLTDISPGMLKVARSKLDAKGLLDRVVIEQMDIRNMRDLPADHFDLSMAQGSPLSYCDDPGRAMAELTRVTRPGGYIIVSVDSRMSAVRAMEQENWEQAEEILATGNIEDDPFLLFPVHSFSIEELEELFLDNDLQIVRVLGKPVFFQQLNSQAQQRILQNEKALERLLDLERQYASRREWAGSAPHFEIVGMKKRESRVQLFRQVWQT
ncbi:MAG: class I SAM-dependent methyltransferase [Anaerolineae bacterium]|nr:class I SAM-dependent methyltransferase [Anaerolineae bacterium]